MLPEAWIKRVTKEEDKRAKSNHTVKMMLAKEYHTNVVAWTGKNVARDVKRHSLRNALLITVSGDRKKTAMWRLDECELSGQTIRLQAIPARMSCDEILERVVKQYPEPMAHGPESCEPSHPLWPIAQRPASRHTRAEAVDTGYPCSLTREIWNPISNQ